MSDRPHHLGPHAHPDLPPPVVATAADLPSAVKAALDDPPEPRVAVIEADGIPFASYLWGEVADPPLLLVHGITASAGIWWRVAPALAAAGYAVTAVDLPGHGRTGHWRGRHRFLDTAADLGAFVRAAGLDRPDLAVVGHSWGAMVAATLPAAGVRVSRLVLIDPPVLPRATIAAMLTEAMNQPIDALEGGRAAGPAWSATDVRNQAEALSQVDRTAARAILLQNGDWDGGLSALGDPAAADVPIRIIRGDPAAGGLVPDSAIPALAERVGAAHILTIAGAEHSPQRGHPAETVSGLLQALGDPA